MTSGAPRPVFIFGVARSGTNLLARALDTHPAAMVALDPLMPLFKAWRNAVAARTTLSQPFDPTSSFQDYYFDADGPALLDAMLGADPDLLLADIGALRQAVRERAALESDALAAVFKAWDGATVADLFVDAVRLLAAHAEMQGGTEPALVAIKEVWTTEFARPLARAFSESCFLVIHRDPRAVLASLIELARRDPGQAAHTVSYMRHWRKHVAVSHRLAGDPDMADRIVAVRYEDLVRRPKKELATIERFLGLPDLMGDGAPGGQDSLPSNSSFAGKGAGIDAGTAERWRAYLSPDVIAAVDYHCGPEMGLLDYMPLDFSGEVGDGVLRHVDEAHRGPGKWRSDAGDPAADMVWEVRRREILNGARASSDEIRRCFLFDEVFGALAGTRRYSQKVSL